MGTIISILQISHLPRSHGNNTHVSGGESPTTLDDAGDT